MEHPAAKAIEELFTTFGGSWPPRAEFDDWPLSWQPYACFADEAPIVCQDYNDPALFRQWLIEKLNEEINLEAVMADLDEHLCSDDMKMLGLFAALTYLVQLYRWGTIPVTPEEAQRTTLKFPEGVWTPFTKISDFWTMAYRGNVFGMCICNALYEGNTKEPTGMRFHFNSDPEVMETEVNFFLAVQTTECIFSETLPLIKDYLNLTQQSSSSESEVAQKMVGRRMEILWDIKGIVVKILKTFMAKMKEVNIRVKYWASHVEAITGWSINAINHGASGGECLTFHLLDEFLGTVGFSEIAKAAVKKRLVCSPQVYKDIFNNLNKYDRYSRFESFLDDKEEDPVDKAHKSIIQSLYLWRLAHTKNAPVYLEVSTMTSGGTVDRLLREGKEGGDIASIGMMALQQRAQEVGKHLYA